MMMMMMMMFSHPLFIQHFEAYLTDTSLSSQSQKQSFIVTAQNLGAITDAQM
jgi:hypothetical protein